MTRISWNLRLGREILKIERKQMRDICFLKFDNTVKPETGCCSVAKLTETNTSHLLSLDF
jgi:hypothetical protein